MGELGNAGASSGPPVSKAGDSGGAPASSGVDEWESPGPYLDRDVVDQGGAGKAADSGGAPASSGGGATGTSADPGTTGDPKEPVAPSGGGSGFADQTKEHGTSILDDMSRERHDAMADAELEERIEERFDPPADFEGPDTHHPSGHVTHPGGARTGVDEAGQPYETDASGQRTERERFDRFRPGGSG